LRPESPLIVGPIQGEHDQAEEHRDRRTRSRQHPENSQDAHQTEKGEGHGHRREDSASDRRSAALRRRHVLHIRCAQPLPVVPTRKEGDGRSSNGTGPTGKLAHMDEYVRAAGDWSGESEAPCVIPLRDRALLPHPAPPNSVPAMAAVASRARENTLARPGGRQCR
jgi:hypothetical protein